MKSLFLRKIMGRTREAGFGATATVMLAACVVDGKAPEVCDPTVPSRSAKCLPDLASDGASYPDRSDY